MGVTEQAARNLERDQASLRRFDARDRRPLTRGNEAWLTPPDDDRFAPLDVLANDDPGQFGDIERDAAAKPEPPADGAAAQKWSTFGSVSDLLTLPPPPTWQLDFIYPAAAVSGHVGDAKTSKSTFERQHAVHVAAGLAFCGRTVRPGRVVLFCAEDSVETVMDGVRAYVRYAGFTATQLELIARNLLFVDARAQRFRLVSSAGGTLHVCGSMTDFVALVKRHNDTAATPIVLAIVDTVARTLDGDETNEAMSKVVQAAELLCAHGVSVVLIHHISKFASREIDLTAHAGRGGSSFPGATRANVMMLKVDLQRKNSDRIVTALLDDGVPVPTPEEVAEITAGMTLPAGVDWSTRLRLFLPINSNYGPTAPPIWFVMLAHEHRPVLVELPFRGSVETARDTLKARKETDKARTAEVKEKQRLRVVVGEALRLHESGVAASKTAIHKACAGSPGLAVLATVTRTLEQAVAQGLLVTHQDVVKNNRAEVYRPGPDLDAWLKPSGIGTAL